MWVVWIEWHVLMSRGERGLCWLCGMCWWVEVTVGCVIWVVSNGSLNTPVSACMALKETTLIDINTRLHTLSLHLQPTYPHLHSNPRPSPHWHLHLHFLHWHPPGCHPPISIPTPTPTSTPTHTPNHTTWTTTLIHTILTLDPHILPLSLVIITLPIWQPFFLDCILREPQTP